ncbi:hypothetical protein TRFO_21551 [Tritrichomonas foetus]|uniref:IPT/TIG domain-containing protein n=1 Tax=Tritrichomonas foetus TaxID=1144522 RepID=A0A1J4KE89_9EUKA|nr:hypothetical protein TRFO_21551 [Tritrichomonas foetus]|eukprot:OHT09507.1 hypothetical protein TRFO_21551 [Tritrichomonas foetus]
MLFLLTYFLLQLSSCKVTTAYFCVDSQHSQKCKISHESYHHISSNEILLESLSVNGQNIVFQIFADVKIINQNHKFHNKISIHGNIESTITINLNDFQNASLSINNAKIINLGVSQINVFSLEFCNVSFVSKSPKILEISTQSFTSDGFSLKTIQTINTERLELSFSNDSFPHDIDFFVKKGSNLYSNENPQIIVSCHTSCDIIFGVNSLKFFFPIGSRQNFIKILSQNYPYIHIETDSDLVNIKCHSNLSPNSFLTPTINVLRGFCTIFGSEWPKQPLPINHHWEEGIFFDTNERVFLILLESESIIFISGSNIPVSIKSNDILYIHPSEKNCGISGKVFVQSPHDSIFPDVKEHSEFFIGEIVNLTENGCLNSNENNIKIVIGNCTNTFSFGGTSKFVCKSIDNTGGLIQHLVNLEEGGNITFSLRLNLNHVYHNILNLINYKPIGNKYKNNGQYNFSKFFTYIGDTLKYNRGKALALISLLKTLGNSINIIPKISTTGKHNIIVKRYDYMNALFYFNIFRYSKDLVCGNQNFNPDDWNIRFEDYIQDTSIPYFYYNNLNLNYTIKEYHSNQDSYCLRLKVTEYPDSAIEVLVFTDNNDIASPLSWLSGALITYISPKKLKKIKSLLCSETCKNIIIIIMNDLPNELNLNGIREDANILIIGASLGLISKITSGNFENLELTKLMPKVQIVHQKLNCLGALFCTIKNSEIQSNIFINIANTILHNNITIHSKEIITDVSSWKQISKPHVFDNLVLIPLDLDSMIFQIAHKVEFLKNKWRFTFANNSNFEMDYSSIINRFIILSGINQSIRLTVDKEAPENLLPFEFGYDVNFERNLSNYPGIPLLEDLNENPIRSNYFFENTISKLFKIPKLLTNFNIKLLNATLLETELLDSSDKIEEDFIFFEGDWNRIKSFQGKSLVFKSDSRKLTVSNFPQNLQNYINLISTQYIVFNDLKSKLFLNHTHLIYKEHEIIVPVNNEVIFSNITSLSKASTLSVIQKNGEEQQIIAKHMKSSIGSTSKYNNAKIEESLEVESDTLTIFNSISFSENAKIFYRYNFERSFPLVVIEEQLKEKPKSIILNYIPPISFPSYLSSDLSNVILNEDLFFFASRPEKILKIRTMINMCTEYSALFYFDSIDERFSQAKNLISLYCLYENGYTIFGLNLTENVIEGSIDKNSFSEKVILITVIPISFMMIVIIILVVLIAYKKNVCRRRVRIGSETSDPLTSDHPLHDIVKPFEEESE